MTNYASSGGSGAPDRPERPLESISSDLNGLYDRIDTLIGGFTELLIHLMGEQPKTESMAGMAAAAPNMGAGDIANIQAKTNDLKIMTGHLESLAAELHKVI
jgi:uncharacterized protein YbjQ (UPF0145 family)